MRWNFNVIITREAKFSFVELVFQAWVLDGKESGNAQVGAE